MRLNSKESGGILLGRIFENQRQFFVDEITQPMPSDRATKTSFYRSKAHHRIAVERWRQSKGYCLYLGLWHTHPQAIPVPSLEDKKDWELAITSGQSSGEVMLFLIVGNQTCRLWMGSKVPGKPTRFIPLTQTNKSDSYEGID